MFYLLANQKDKRALFPDKTEKDSLNYLFENQTTLKLLISNYLYITYFDYNVSSMVDVGVIKPLVLLISEIVCSFLFT